MLTVQLALNLIKVVADVIATMHAHVLGIRIHGMIIHFVNVDVKQIYLVQDKVCLLNLFVDASVGLGISLVLLTKSSMKLVANANVQIHDLESLYRIKILVDVNASVHNAQVTLYMNLIYVIVSVSNHK